LLVFAIQERTAISPRILKARSRVWKSGDMT